MSVISLLSAEVPNLDSPANVDAAVEVRNDFAGTCFVFPLICVAILMKSTAYKKKVRRLVRRSAEEAFD